MPTKLPFKQQINLVLLLSGIIAAIEVINFFTGRALNNYGLIPREGAGLLGIFTSPLLHGSIWHFFSNIIPFALFSFLLLQHGTSRYIQVTITCTVISGILVWLFARSAVHVGASGLIRYIQVTITCTVVSGILVWLFARSAVHVGASGLIYGYFGYLVLAGLMSRKFKLIIISLFVGIAYGTLIFGVLPVGRYISWESHLFGLLVGLGYAYAVHKK